MKFYENSFEYFRMETNSLGIADRVPVLKPFYYRTYKKVGNTLRNLSLNVRQKYIEHLPDHQKGLIRDFCDALIEAKEEAIEEDKESAPHLTDQNLSLVILNLFFGQYISPESVRNKCIYFVLISLCFHRIIMLILYFYSWQ